ncbi:MAG: hypothetical protein J6U30_06495 [Oscillospiraceae bacterium]|nr:hypothetical protein [Oscillospiraceae bacterium]
MKKILSILLIVTLLLSGCAAKKEGEPVVTTKDGVRAVRAVYPEQAMLPDFSNNVDYDTYEEQFQLWRAGRVEKAKAMSEEVSMEHFYREAMTAFLLDKDKGENAVLSPLNIYLALSLLAESTDADTRQQILDVLGRTDIAEARKQAQVLWEANYLNEGPIVSILANSVWLHDGLPVKADWEKMMSEEYMASIFSGDMGSDAMKQALRDWLDEQTNGLLKESAQNLDLPVEAMLVLCSTIYFKGSWKSEFDKSQTQEQVFHGAKGDTTCQMMHQSTFEGYFAGDHFTSVSQTLDQAGQMVFILPEEGMTPEELLSDEQALACMIGYDTEYRQILIHESIPRIDVSADFSLNDTLKQLGITKVFGMDADFSPVTDKTLYLDRASHAARVTVDEEGVEAAAFTVLAMAEGAFLPEDEVDFVLDRPFIFLIKGIDGQILFAGIVNQI